MEPHPDRRAVGSRVCAHAAAEQAHAAAHSRSRRHAAPPGRMRLFGSSGSSSAKPFPRSSSPPLATPSSLFFSSLESVPFPTALSNPFVQPILSPRQEEDANRCLGKEEPRYRRPQIDELRLLFPEAEGLVVWLLMAPRAKLSPSQVMAELRELKADIYELGRSLDNGTFARRPRNVLSRTKDPRGLSGSSPRCSPCGAQGQTVLRQSSCRSGDDHGGRSPPPRLLRPTNGTHKEAISLSYADVSDVPRLVQRVEESARVVSSEKEDALQALRAEKDETSRLREALWQAGGVKTRWKELVEESRALKQKLESTERIRLHQKELIAELQAAEADVAFAVAAGVAPRTFSPSRERAKTYHANSFPPLHRNNGRRSDKPNSRTKSTMACESKGIEKKGGSGSQRQRRLGFQSDGGFCAIRVRSRSLEGGGSVRLRSSSAGRGSEAKVGTTANTRRRDKSRESIYTSLVRFPASEIGRDTVVVIPQTAGKVSKKNKLVARRKGSSGALDGKGASCARRSRLSLRQEKMRAGIGKTSAVMSGATNERPSSRVSRFSRGLKVHDKIRRSSQMSTKDKVPRRSSRRDAGFCAPTASSSGKVRQ